jgi:hypothetical protein
MSANEDLAMSLARMRQAGLLAKHHIRYATGCDLN